MGMWDVAPFSQVKRTRLVVFVLLLGTFALYWPVRHFGWVVYDDNEYVVQNPAVSSGLTWAHVTWAFTQTHSANWHPLTWLSHMLDCTLWGLDPGPPHLVNAALHALNAAVLFAVLFTMTGARWRSALVAALFAWHPLAVESVAWVAERKNVLSSLFWLLTIWAYVRYDRAPNRKRYLVVMGLFIMGILTKPMLVTLPCTLLLLDWWPLGRFSRLSWRRLVWEKMPLLLVSAVAAMITLVAQTDEGAVANLPSLGMILRMKNALVSYVGYLGKAVCPQDLIVFYPYPHAIANGLAAAAGLLLMTISALVVWQRRARPWLIFGWCWYLGTLVPVIGLVQAGSQAMADRYTYVPLIGIFIAVVWEAGELARQRPKLRPLLALLALALPVACLDLTRAQLPFWQNGITLFNHELAVGGDDILQAHLILGDSLNAVGRAAEAADQYAAAIRVNPNNAEAHNNLGNLLSAEGRYGDAIHQYEAALKIDSRLVGACYNLARAEAALRLWPSAIANYKLALKLDPKQPLALGNLGVIYLQSGQVPEAIAEFEEALRILPTDAAACNNLGQALAVAGRDAEAAARLELAVKLNPDYLEAHYNLGNLLLRQGHPADALSHFEAAVRLKPDYAEAHNHLGIALAQLGRTAEAILHFDKALQLNPSLTEVAHNLELARQQLEKP